VNARYPLSRAVITGAFRFERKPYAVQAKKVESNLVRTLLPQRFSPELDDLAQGCIVAVAFRTRQAVWCPDAGAVTLMKNSRDQATPPGGSRTPLVG
jgi:hypothetical protein